MSLVLWILQAGLALHTAIGAGWKLFNPAVSVPSLSAIPGPVWLALIPLELLLALGLVAPALAPSWGWLVPVAALGIAAEMLAFSVLHLRAGAGENGQMVYWLVVAALCALVALGRLFVAPQ